MSITIIQEHKFSSKYVIIIGVAAGIGIGLLYKCIKRKKDNNESKKIENKTHTAAERQPINQSTSQKVRPKENNESADSIIRATTQIHIQNTESEPVIDQQNVIESPISTDKEKSNDFEHLDHGNQEQSFVILKEEKTADYNEGISKDERKTEEEKEEVEQEIKDEESTKKRADVEESDSDIEPIEDICDAENQPIDRSTSQEFNESTDSNIRPTTESETVSDQQNVIKNEDQEQSFVILKQEEETAVYNDSTTKDESKTEEEEEEEEEVEEEIKYEECTKKEADVEAKCSNIESIEEQQMPTESTDERKLCYVVTDSDKEDASGDLQTGDTTEEVSEAFLIHPYSKEKTSLGLSIKTTITQIGPYHRRSKHVVKDVKPKSLAYKCSLRNGMELCLINDVPTDGMTNAMIIGQLEAIKIDESAQLILTINQEYQTEYGATRETRTNATIQFSISTDDIFVKSCIKSPYCGDKHIEASKPCGKLYTEEICWIKHQKTEYYLCVHQNGHLIMAALQTNPSAFLFRRQMFSGIDKTERSPFCDKPVVVLAFKDTVKEMTDFVVGTTKAEVGLMKLSSLSQTLSVLNDEDPRFFYCIESTNENKYFMSVHFTDHYLAYNKESGLGLVCISVPKGNKLDNFGGHLEKYDDIKFTIKYQSKKSDIPSNSTKKTIV